MSANWLIPAAIVGLGVTVAVAASASEDEDYSDNQSGMDDATLGAYQHAILFAYDPVQIRELAAQLEARGFVIEASELRKRATSIEAMTEQEYVNFVGDILRSFGTKEGTEVPVRYKGGDKEIIITV